MKPLEEKVAQLIKVLDNIILLLEWDGNKKRWVQTIMEAKQGLQYSDLYGIEALLGTYGGMGSFNDLYIGQKFDNSNFIGWKDGSNEKNSILNLLRKEAYDLATEIKRKGK